MSVWTDEVNVFSKSRHIQEDGHLFSEVVLQFVWT